MSSIIKLRVMPTEKNSQIGFKMLPTALVGALNMYAGGVFQMVITLDRN